MTDIVCNTVVYKTKNLIIINYYYNIKKICICLYFSASHNCSVRSVCSSLGLLSFQSYTEQFNGFVIYMKTNFLKHILFMYVHFHFLCYVLILFRLIKFSV